jgi:hypothetical protein
MTKQREKTQKIKKRRHTCKNNRQLEGETQFHYNIWFRKPNVMEKQKIFQVA